MASVGAIALAGTALAADLPSRAPPPVIPPPPPVFTWTGPYAGLQIGYAWGNNTATYGDALGVFGVTSYSGNGVIGGAHVGYNIQLSQFVIGLEGDVNGSSISKTFNTGPFVPFLGFVQPITYNSNANVQGSIVGRVGYAWDRVLLYALGGVAFAGTNVSVQAGFPTYTYDQASNARVGWTVGGGLEYAVTDNWSLRAEYRYAQFGTYTVYPVNYATFDPGAFVNRKFTENRVQVGFSYKFVTAPPPPAPLVTK
jgi:outer membrane immunogenic protein